MPEFICKLGTSDGKMVEKEFFSKDKEKLVEKLEQENYHIFSIKKKNPVLSALKKIFTRKKGTVKRYEFILFNQEFTALLKAGLPVTQGLDILLNRMEEGPFRSALEDIIKQVESGTSLSEAFESHGDFFPSVYYNSLKAGEKSGQLPGVIDRFIDYSDKINTIKKNVISALIYPALLLFIISIILGVLLFYVVPRFTKFYSGFQTELPAITKAVVGFSQFASNNIVFIILALAGAIFGYKIWQQTEKGRRTIDRIKLKLPFVGTLINHFLTSQMTRTLATLLAGGIPAVESLRIASRSVGNTYLSSKLSGAVEKVREGVSMNQALEEAGFLDNVVIEMIEVGESTGALEEMLNNVADFYDEEIQTTLDRFITFFEPVVLVMMAIFVGIILLSIYLPIFRTVSAIR